MKFKEYHKILGVVFAAAVLGAVIGYGFFYLFEQPAAAAMEKFKVLQGFFGIREFEPAMSIVYVSAVIFLGNLFSTFGYFGLGWLKASLPMGFITGFFLSVFLFTGTIRHGIAIPIDVYVLVTVEAIYRVMALSLGEFFQKNKTRNKRLVWGVSITIGILFLFGVLYELFSLYV